MRLNRSHRSIFALAACVAFAAPAFAQDTPNGWTPEWSDEFNGTSVDANRWNVLDRVNSYNNEKQAYVPSAVTVAGGLLNIRASKTPAGSAKAYQSGLLRTKAQQQYGRWEVKASLPTGQGMWPAIWLLAPDNITWPSGGEIDIMENKGNAPTVVSSAYHYGQDYTTHQYVTKNFSYTVNNTPVSFHNSMHTYGVEWDPSRVRYLVDNVPSYTIYKPIPISSTGMDMILNLAVGGDFGGDPNASTVFPQSMLVDYAHAFSRDNTTRALNNASFEAKSGNLFQEWDEYSVGSNVVIDSAAANAHTGTTAVQMYGKFNGTSDNTSGLYQEMPAVEGETFQVGAFSKNRPGDKLAGSNVARIKLEFRDEKGALLLTSYSLDVANAASPDTYRESVVRQTAPANTMFARAILEMRQLNNAGGAVDFDDASLSVVKASALPGDINLDGTRNAADLDALNHSLATVNSAFNFNADASVNAADVDSLLASAFNTKRGDANLDGKVNFDDLVVLAQNYNLTGTGNWAIGDFTGDSTINFDDLVSLAQNYNFGTTDGAVSAAAFQSDWTLAQALVPEPTTTFLGAALTLIASRRRMF